MLKKEECTQAWGNEETMQQCRCTASAKKGGVSIRHGAKVRSAAQKNAQIVLWKEAYALCTEQRSSYAVLKDAQMESLMEECAESLGQKSNNAASKDAQTKCGVAGYAGGIEHIAIHTMNPLRSDLHKTNATQTLPNENACRVIGGHLDRSSVQERWPSSVKK